MTRPIILLDVDGVIADFYGAVARVLYLNNSSRPQATKWDFIDDLKRQRPGDYKVYKQRSSQPSFCLGIDPYDGAADFVNRLREYGEVVAVTSPLTHCPTWCAERRDWLMTNFAFSPDDIIFARRKELVVGDIFIDDKYEHLNAWNDRWCGAHNDGIARCVLIGHPYSEEHQVDEDGDFYVRCEAAAWTDIIDAVDGIVACPDFQPITGRDFH